jgi:hypothetical protein
MYNVQDYSVRYNNVVSWLYVLAFYAHMGNTSMTASLRGGLGQ